MGTIQQKLTNITNAVNDIYSAVIEVGGEITNATPLREVPAAIRAITTDYVDISPQKDKVTYAKGTMTIMLSGSKSIAITSTLSGVVFHQFSNTPTSSVTVGAGIQSVTMTYPLNPFADERIIIVKATLRAGGGKSKTFEITQAANTAAMTAYSASGFTFNKSMMAENGVKVYQDDKPSVTANSQSNGGYSLSGECNPGVSALRFELAGRISYPLYHALAAGTKSYNVVMCESRGIELDAALIPASRYNASAIGYGAGVPDGCFVHPTNHIWVKFNGVPTNPIFSIGITKKFLDEHGIGSIESISLLFAVGGIVSGFDAPFFRINSVHEFPSPLKVIQVSKINTDLISNPQLAVTDPYAGGYIAELKPTT